MQKFNKELDERLSMIEDGLGLVLDDISALEDFADKNGIDKFKAYEDCVPTDFDRQVYSKVNDLIWYISELRDFLK